LARWEAVIASLAFSAEQEWVCECTTCGVIVVGPQVISRLARENGREFWCINGHSNRFGKTAVQKLEDQLAAKARELETERSRVAAARAKADLAERSAAAHKGKVTEIQNRIQNGVCPCCKRSFTNLRRHMATKHPEHAK
jgi:hypothetical protein